LNRQQHWERIYATKAPDQMSWFRPHLETSIALIERSATDRSASIIDVGGGTSTLVDDLLARGFRDITVVDISQTALNLAKKRLGEASTLVRWLDADVTQAPLQVRTYNIWHDRAVFHFLTEPEQRLSYVNKAASSLKIGGHLIVSTFGPQSPARCSGLEVMRYDPGELLAALGSRFRLVESSSESHHTPFGTTQQFLYCHCILES
jgi:ubiquinone/menaquinone biosynthesis C-methylase UbiE